MRHHHYTGFLLQQQEKSIFHKRYWQDKSTENLNTIEKNYSCTIEVDLPHKPGALGHISSLIGLNREI